MARTIQAPRGTQLTCKNWQIEAAYRMLQNNLDPQVAFDPDNLIVYGGRGRAARNWAAFDAILDALRDLQPDLVPSWSRDTEDLRRLLHPLTVQADAGDRRIVRDEIVRDVLVKDPPIARLVIVDRPNVAPDQVLGLLG